MTTFILLDLGELLDGKSGLKRPICHEKYRADLVEAVRGKSVILLSDRPMVVRQKTLARMLAELRWLPLGAYFDLGTGLPECQAKEELLKQILRKYGRRSPFLAIEGCPEMRALYGEYGIRAMSVQEMITQGKRQV